MNITKLNDNWLIVTPDVITRNKQDVKYRLWRYAQGKDSEMAGEYVLSEWVTTTTKSETAVYVFSDSQYQTMVSNYEKGKCAINENGLARYADAHTTNGIDWFGKPASTARKLAKDGVPLPKKLYSLMARILDNC